MFYKCYVNTFRGFILHTIKNQKIPESFFLEDFLRKSEFGTLRGYMVWRLKFRANWGDFVNNFFRFLNLRISGYSPAITVVMPRKIFYACNKGSMWTTYPIFSLFSLFLPAKSFKLLKKTFSPLKGLKF